MAVATSGLAAACGALVLLVAVVADPRGFAVLLLLYNVLVVAGIAGVVLAGYAVRQAVRTHVLDRRLAVADALLVPALLFAANLAYGTRGWAGDAAEVLAFIGLGGAVVSLLLWLYARVTAA
jgi:hypothetical protein